MPDIPREGVAMSTTGLGAVLLPHSHHNTLLMVFSITSLAVGALVICSHLASRIVSRFL